MSAPVSIKSCLCANLVQLRCCGRRCLRCQLVPRPPCPRSQQYVFVTCFNYPMSLTPLFLHLCRVHVSPQLFGRRRTLLRGTTSSPMRAPSSSPSTSTLTRGVCSLHLPGVVHVVTEAWRTRAHVTLQLGPQEAVDTYAGPTEEGWNVRKWFVPARLPRHSFSVPALVSPP